MAVVSMKALLETGVHFGHRTRRWHPKMKPYIFTERNGIHILDLQQTTVILHNVYELVRDTVAEGGTILFVGTKRQAQDTIEQEATRAGMPYVNQRWLGGTLTNWQTIRQRINHLHTLERRRDNGEFDGLKKKELLMVEREIERLNKRLGGIRMMDGLPQLLFVVDINNEDTSILEANSLSIPVIAMVDTNCNPDSVDHVIPSNDDAIRAIRLITSKIADAAIEGANMRKEGMDDDGTQSGEVGTPGRPDLHDASDEDLLGAGTRKKIAAEEARAAEVAAAAAAKAAEAAAKAAEAEITADPVAPEGAAEAATEAVVEAVADEAPAADDA